MLVEHLKAWRGVAKLKRIPCKQLSKLNIRVNEKQPKKRKRERETDMERKRKNL